MSFHTRIMNIQAQETGATYRLGHRDARHAAAEIANEADSEIEQLKIQLRQANQSYDELLARYEARVEEHAQMKRELETTKAYITLADEAMSAAHDYAYKAQLAKSVRELVKDS